MSAFVVDRGPRAEPHRYAVVDGSSSAVLALEQNEAEADELARWLSGEGDWRAKEGGH